MNKYRKWHNEIIKRAKIRILNGYSEKHHIKPKCLGGSNEKSNIVKLTYREHFLVHWLLTKFTKGKNKGKMIHAFAMMSCRVKGRGHVISSWQYELLRKASFDLAIGKTFSDERRKNISKSLKGKKLSEETKLKMSLAKIGNKNLLGFKHSEKSKIKTSKTIRAMWKNRPHPNIGLKHSIETRMKKREFSLKRERGDGGRWT